MTEFITFLSEVFARFGVVKARKMFGGYGVYHDGIMFALVVNDTLYLKADQSVLAHFSARGLGPFEYSHGDRQIKMSYYQAPEELFDDPDEAAVWARRSYEIALRNKKTIVKKVPVKPAKKI